MNLTGSRYNPFALIILILTLAVPLLVLPMVLDNAFNTPKTTLMLMGVSLMLGIYCYRFLRGRGVLAANTSIPVIMLVLILLNLFSFFYTTNRYYSIHAAMMNLTCLFLIYFVSLYLDSKTAFFVLAVAAISGVLVSVETYLQFLNIFVLFKWAHPGIMVMGTIGNSNYLGAYLVFPLFALAGLVFLLKGKRRLIPLVCFIFVLGALLFTRARAGWFGFFLSLPVFLLLIMKIHKISVIGYIRSNFIQAATWFFVSLSLVVSLWYIAPQRLHTMMDYRNITNAMTLKLRMEKYSKASLWLFKQSPLFGTGLWSFRNQVFEAQAQINKKEPFFFLGLVDDNYFKNYPEPKPESVHNEYLEVFNDGGVVAAAVILLFLIMLIRHALRVIKDETLDVRDRIIAATALSAVIAIMLAAFFFFPFRINSTFFMTSLMMGLMEGIYLRSYGLISTRSIGRLKTGSMLIPLIILLLIGVVWFKGIKPFKAEMEHFKYKVALARGNAQDAEKYILNAIAWDPHNSTYNFWASQLYLNVFLDYGKASDYIDKAIWDYNGDLTMWSLYFIKGLLKFQAGSMLEAKAAFEKSLYYNPTFQEARLKLDEVNKVIKDHDRVMIKFR